ncbi:MAG: hypothetical protein WC677_01420 [Clostridia bacterium]
MLKRIGAIVLLIGFVLLIVNLLLIQYALKESLIIYAVIAVSFLLLQNKAGRKG